MGAPETRICYEHAESLCHSLDRPLLHAALLGQWRYTLATDKLSAAMQIAERLYSLAQEQDDPTLMVGATALAATLYFLGDFESAREYAIAGIRSGAREAPISVKIWTRRSWVACATRRLPNGIRRDASCREYAGGDFIGEGDEG